MPQAQTYQSEFTGLEMDARFAAVAQLAAALEALTTVVAQKYVKPASGIPSTDMDADVQAALAKANTAVQSLADYYTKSEVDQLLAAINGMDYVDVAALPTASASTLGKIYLVGPDASGYYAYYYTSYDGSAYSWVGPLGTTQISLANYATKEELSQLDQKVDEVDSIEANKSSYSFELGTISATGAESNNTKRIRSFYIPADKGITVRGDSDHLFSVRYYDGAHTFLSSEPSDWVSEHSLTNMPSNCAYFRIVGRNGAGTDISDVSAFSAGFDITKSTVDFLAANQELTQMTENLYVKKLAYILTTGKVVDARVGNSNFGKLLNQNNWGCSQYVDLQGAKYIRLYRNVASTSSNGGCSGLVFYDKDSNPITAGAVQNIYGNGSQESAFSEWTIHKVPDNARFFRVGVSQATAAIYDYPIELYALAPENVAGLQDKGYTKNYYGEKVDLSADSYEWRPVCHIISSVQSAAISGKYLFVVKNKLASVTLFDMETMSIIYTLEPGLSVGDEVHCNQAQFGKYKYDEDDLFPLLYVVAQNNAQGRCAWYGYRIIPTLTDGVITSFAISLVQTIYLPVMTDDNCLGNANLAVDLPNDCIWAYSRNNRAEADNYLRAKFTKFAIPALYDGSDLISEVTLSDADILDSFDADWSMQYAQGGFIHRGRLYFGQGAPSYGFVYMRVVDLYAQRKQVSFFDLLNDGVSAEPEGMFTYDGRIWIHANSGLLYRIDV